MSAAATTPAAAPARKSRVIPKPEVTVVQAAGLVHWNQASPWDGLLGVQRIVPDRLPVTLASNDAATGKLVWGQRLGADGRMDLGVRRVINGHVCALVADVWVAYGLRAPRGRHAPVPLPGGPLDLDPHACLAAGDEHPDDAIDTAIKLARAAAADFAAALEVARVALHNRSPEGRAAKRAWDTANAEKLEEWRAEHAEQIAEARRAWARDRRRSPIRRGQADGRRTLPTTLPELQRLLASIQADTSLEPKQRANRLFYVRRRIAELQQEGGAS